MSKLESISLQQIKTLEAERLENSLTALREQEKVLEKTGFPVRYPGDPRIDRYSRKIASLRES